MAVPTATRAAITPPSLPSLLTPLLPALTTAAVAREPASNVLPLLSPILRQRVQFLSASSTDPWLRLLCYDRSKAATLQEIATSGELDPHPVSGEVELDWDYDVETRYRRPDSETLQALVALKELGLGFQLVWCVGDKEGGGDGWRIGEVTAVEKGASNVFGAFGGYATIGEADTKFQEGLKPKQAAQKNDQHLSVATAAETNDEDSDDGYWDRYDATPSRTPAQNHSPAPGGMAGSSSSSRARVDHSATDEDDYFAQYDSVQPAMDNHDPDEEAAAAEISPPLGLSHSQQHQQHLDIPEPQESTILHPRPESSASSNKGSDTVARLEEQAGRQDQSEFGIKQHVSRSIRSLWLLSKATGIEREEFERLVKTELDVLGMMEDEY